jgi:hypothetical protein
LIFDFRKRRKKILIRLIETRHPDDSSDSDDNEDSIPPPPPGSPKLYHTAEFIAKFACKDLPQPSETVLTPATS